MKKLDRQVKREIRLRISDILDNAKETGRLTVEQEKEVEKLGKLLSVKLVSEEKTNSDKLPFAFDFLTFTVSDYLCLRNSGYTVREIEQMCVGSNKQSFFEWRVANGLTRKRRKKTNGRDKKEDRNNVLY